MTKPDQGRPHLQETERRIHRINVNFSEDAYAELTALAERRGKTISDVIREAIALEVWFEKTVREGGKILVERDRRAREVILR